MIWQANLAQRQREHDDKLLMKKVFNSWFFFPQLQQVFLTQAQLLAGTIGTLGPR
jgi:hypothetical protein